MHFILGVGTIGLDYISFMDKYPEEDSKVRSRAHKIGGGGNIGNTATAISRLGLCRVGLLTQVGRDSNATSILDELKRDGVDTSLVVQNSEITTPFTYIIVDSTNNTRTCIHTPMEREMTVEQIRQIVVWDGKPHKNGSATKGPMGFKLPFLIHLDSRQTEASLELVKTYERYREMDESGNFKKPIISIDCEKYRPPLMRTLLDHCNVVFTNEKFPEIFHQIKDPEVEQGFPGIGLRCIHDRGNAEVSGLSVVLGEDEELLASILKKVNGMADISCAGKISMVITSLGAMGSLLLCGSNHRGHKYGPGPDGLERPIKMFEFSRDESERDQDGVLGSASYRQTYRVLYCPAFPLTPESVVDTTGAGDAFIGGFLSTFCQPSRQNDLCGAMIMGTLTAAKNIMKSGARDGLPTGPEDLKDMYNLFSMC